MWLFLFSPVLCAAIGWFTNYLAVKMLFHPKVATKIGPFVVQGIFPKRQAALAEKLGDLVENELVSAADVTELLRDPEVAKQFDGIVGEYLDRMLRENLVKAIPMASMFLNEEMLAKIKTKLIPELEKLIPEILEQASHDLENRFDVKALVREKVEQFSTDKLETILFSIMQKEFKFIEIVGGVLGFAIGLFQALFLMLVG
ncbi:DUF445 domain-containing protein [Desulfovibrio inopinatus]|uniref:DUF445 domain-containing protein n=1 Tax=Desulfovibrio inopinatus TaxID=102109 RepID=UPI0003F7380B|nr:DUF445 family protein [Desulfovibrio inopinatus]